MEDLQGDMEKNVGPKRPGKAAKRDRRWTLMLVADDGRMRTLRWYKPLVVLLVLLLAAAVGSAGVLYWLYEGERRRTHQLEEALAAGRRPVSEEPAGRSGVPSADSGSVKAPAGGVEPTEASGPTETDPPPAAPEAAEIPPPTNDPRPGPGPAAVLPEPGVRIEDFRSSVENGGESLKITFKILNIDEAENRVSGHVILVLKPDDVRRAHWVSLPSTPLIGGRPTGEEEGQGFAITNYKRMRFTLEDAGEPGRFTIATVHVFSDSGALMLEEDFPLIRSGQAFGE